MTPNPDPAVTSVSLPVRGPGGAVVAALDADLELWEMSGKIVVPTTDFDLPAGRFLVRVSASAAGDSNAAPGATWEEDVTLGSPDTVTSDPLVLRQKRDIDGTDRELRVRASVHKRRGAAWIPYASSRPIGSDVDAVTLAASPSPDPADVPPFGAGLQHVAGGFGLYVNQTWLNRTADALVSAGAEFVRSGISWQDLYPTSAAIDTTRRAAYDAYFAALDARGLTSYIQLGAGAPAWAATGGVGGAPPSNWTRYEEFVDAAMTRWGDVIRRVEGNNEPNGNLTWTPSNQRDMQAYLYDVVKAYDPTIEVYGAVLSMCDEYYLQLLYDEAFWQGKYDAVCIHPYQMEAFATTNPRTNGAFPWDESAPEWSRTDEQRIDDAVLGLAGIHEVMRANGDGAVGIMVGETGFYQGFSGASKTQRGYDVPELTAQGWMNTLMRQLARIPYVIGVNVWTGRDSQVDVSGNPLTDAQTDITKAGLYGMTSHEGLRLKPALTGYGDAVSDLQAGTG